MQPRAWWQARVTAALAKRNVVWLSGVRRVGKTTLARSREGIEYFDCELLRVRHQLDDPESFFETHGAKRTLVIDEIHRLANPSEVLKIAADHFPRNRLLHLGGEVQVLGFVGRTQSRDLAHADAVRRYGRLRQPGSGSAHAPRRLATVLPG
jgi:predicted AAA+ superfamily ATPase